MNGDLVPVLFLNLCGGIFVLTLIGLGVYLIVFSQRSKKKADASQAWPSTTGIISKSELKSSTSRNDDGDETVTYYPAVTYDFTFEGHSYTGKKLSFGGVISKSNPASAQKTLQSYPVGAQVPVYYNPTDPSEAVLERTAAGMKWGMSVGIICLVLSVCIACPLLFSLVSRLFNSN